ncbi:MAG: hypothetical protein HUU06_14265 [Planctomycetaceae bacterium]|nr:hypothetical protein [Planctomycetota bacterium]NUN53932.1 hypothetical protein [Planctomycetaceae bacterium]
MASIRRCTGSAAARAVLAGGLLLAAVPGCDPSLYKKTKLDLYEYRAEGGARLDVRSIHMSFKGKDTAPTMPVLRISTKKDGSGQFAFTRLNHDFRNPFCYSVGMGMFDPMLPLPASPAFSATEISHRDSDPLVYYGIGVQYFSGGAQAFGYKNGSSNIGTVTFSGTDKVEVGFYTVGSTLSFMARKVGDEGFTTFATSSYDGGLGPFVPSVGGANLSQRNTGFGFALPVIYYNTQAGDPSLEDSIADDVDCAWEAYLDFCDAYADGDYADADDALLDALEYLDGAYEDAGSLSDPKRRSTVQKDLASAISSLEKARAMIGDERPFRSINRLVIKGFDKSAEVLPEIRSFQTRL